jgi:hypothetical protein
MTVRVVRRNGRGKCPSTPRNRRLQVALTTAALIVVVSACGSSTKAGSGPGTSAGSSTVVSPSSPSVGASAPASTSKSVAAGGQPNVCSLLTAAQASSIVGVTVTAVTPSLGGKVCLYTGPNVPMNVTLMVNSGGAAAWTEELATLKEGGGDTPVALSGLGDRAAETTGSLATQSGDWIIQVDAADESSVNGGNIGGDFTKSTAVARAILAAQH